MREKSKPGFAITAAVILLPLGLAVSSCTQATGSTQEIDQTQSNLSPVTEAGPVSVAPSEPHGMSWNLRHVEGKTGIVAVGCGGGDFEDCNPYHGDTVCTEALPVLCFNEMDAPRPFSIGDSNQYMRWSGGLVHTTAPYTGTELTTLAEANAVCVHELGPDWRVAEFHDGWGWNFLAYGNVGDPSLRFWVDINDQPNGTCWDR